jgi:hypothetical protein
MLNKKPILVSGFSRGGTNILWNIFQSHPHICAPEHETGAIFRYTDHLKFCHFIRVADKLGLLHTSLSHKIIDFQLYRYKLKNLHKPENKYKYEGQIYSKNEVANSVCCLKSVDKDIFHTDLLLDVYPDLNIVFLVRNGYAIAEGHSRRGMSIQKSAENYVSVGNYMLELKNKHNRCTIIKFEDILECPFTMSSNLFEFINLNPYELEKIRLKSKKVVKNSNVHEVPYGTNEKKYWFSKDQISQILDPEINKKQISNLKADQIKEFNDIAGQQLTEFGYEKIEV